MLDSGKGIFSGILSKISVAAVLLTGCGQDEPTKAQKPNIVLIMADDMGYGDIGAYNPGSKAPTPSLDQLAGEGMRFTDAHTPSSVCSPTRYALLTGRYAWRTRLKQGVLWSYSRALIEDGRETLATLLKKQGYQTAAIGKWHLGFGDYDAQAEEEKRPYWDDAGNIDKGVTSVGFDYYFGIASSLDIPPYFYIENDKIRGNLLADKTPASVRRWEGGGGFWREGLITDDFDHEEVLPELTKKAVGYIHDKAANKDQPFFLYMPLPAPHTPWMPTEKFRGASEAGYYGDFVAMVDDSVGQVLKALADTGADENTLVIYTSDNGAHWREQDEIEYGHLANGDWRGQKADIHEAGHRVPFIVKWPGKVKAGSQSDQLLTLTDIMATFADYFDISLDAGVGPDSFSILPAIMGEGYGERASAIHHSLRGQFAIRRGDWKLIEGLGSGGFTEPRTVEPKEGQSPYQLYNLADDPTESNNVFDENPEVLERLLRELNEIRAE